MSPSQCSLSDVFRKLQNFNAILRSSRTCSITIFQFRALLTPSDGQTSVALLLHSKLLRCLCAQLLLNCKLPWNAIKLLLVVTDWMFLLNARRGWLVAIFFNALFAGDFNCWHSSHKSESHIWCYCKHFCRRIVRACWGFGQWGHPSSQRGCRRCGPTC